MDKLLCALLMVATVVDSIICGALALVTIFLLTQGPMSLLAFLGWFWRLCSCWAL